MQTFVTRIRKVFIGLHLLKMLNVQLFIKRNKKLYLQVLKLRVYSLPFSKVVSFLELLNGVAKTVTLFITGNTTPNYLVFTSSKFREALKG